MKKVSINGYTYIIAFHFHNDTVLLVPPFSGWGCGVKELAQDPCQVLPKDQRTLPAVFHRDPGCLRKEQDGCLKYHSLPHTLFPPVTQQKGLGRGTICSTRIEAWDLHFRGAIWSFSSNHYKCLPFPQGYLIILTLNEREHYSQIRSRKRLRPGHHRH